MTSLTVVADALTAGGLDAMPDIGQAVVIARCPVCNPPAGYYPLTVVPANDGTAKRVVCANGCNEAGIRMALPPLGAQPEQGGAVPPRDDTFDPGRWADVLLKALTEAQQPSIPLPFVALNEALDGGLRPGEVCVVAGYTSHGKSTFIDQIADSAAAEGRRVHLYLTEMTAVARGMRLLARRAGVPLRALKRRNLKADQYKRVLTELNALPYGVSIVAGWDVEKVVKHIADNRWDLAVVDLIHGFHYADERELSKTSSALVAAAKGWQPGTAIVTAAHLNDGQMRDSRSPKRPRPGLHSLKGSSSLKQDPDVVMFVWREDGDDGIPTDDGEIWVAKNRDGELTGLNVWLNGPRMRFEERAA